VPQGEILGGSSAKNPPGAIDSRGRSGYPIQVVRQELKQHLQSRERLYGQFISDAVICFGSVADASHC
jgi:hypothetical protein